MNLRESLLDSVEKDL